MTTAHLLFSPTGTRPALTRDAAIFDPCSGIALTVALALPAGYQIINEKIIDDLAMPCSVYRVGRAGDWWYSMSTNKPNFGSFDDCSDEPKQDGFIKLPLFVLDISHDSMNAAVAAMAAFDMQVEITNGLDTHRK